MGPPPTEHTAGEPVRRRRSRGQRVLVGLGVLVAFACLVVGVGVGYTWWRYRQIDRQDLDLAAVDLGAPKNYLIVGSDSREVVDESDPNRDAFVTEEIEDEPQGQRSDTIMVVRVDPDARTIDLVSFPRDLWIPISGTSGNERINTAYAIGGPQQLIDTLEADFGIPIHHYLELDFRSFKDIVGAIDGVPMYFQSPMRDTTTGFYVDTAGCVTLDADQALAFARSRHLQFLDTRLRWVPDPTGDLGRIDRQQVFVRRVIDRASDKATSLDLKATNDLLVATVQHLRIDDQLGLQELLTLGRRFRDYTGEQLRTHSLPVKPYTTAGGAAVVKLVEPDAQRVLDIFRGVDPDAPAPVDPSRIRLTIHNGSGVSGQAADARDAFEELGYTVVATGNAVTEADVTVVRHAAGDEVLAAEVARHLPGSVLREDRTLTPGEVTVVTGSNFTTVTGSATTGVSRRDDGATDDGATDDGTTDTTENPYADTEGVTPAEPPPGVECR